ncbi:MAG TPA: hypothetical protein VHY18_09770 [Solirubrobacteraceae bacterium]|jgi:hypothetical protein|nr:hypothetical protein [Solirubrobacteraceae bacterium]
MGKPHVGGRAMAPLLALAAVSLAVLGFAAPALAGKPTGRYANFSQCPLKVTGVNFCIFGQTSSGEFKIKKTQVPITKTITLQGGIIVPESGGETFVNAANGETLSKTPENVPGGLLKIIAPKGWPEILQVIFNEFISKGITGVNASTELVGNVTISRGSLLAGLPDALGLPVRVHLENSFLGSGCYVGSKAHPVNLELTTGATSPPLPNESIKGSLGEPEFIEEDGEDALLVLRKNSLVNNTFSAPEAEGCGSQYFFGLFTGLIDDAVDAELGLPSASGNNTAILDGTLENASATAVKRSE